ncbi:hypothetical protein T492DRAFT_931205 [Pavlovales sp. CCMP2436]|nr:hypothetical protein T492DRAFT_931205 [Pavlovales sp. CCMP2436]
MSLLRPPRERKRTRMSKLFGADVAPEESATPAGSLRLEDVHQRRGEDVIALALRAHAVPPLSPPAPSPTSYLRRHSKDLREFTPDYPPPHNSPVSPPSPVVVGNEVGGRLYAPPYPTASSTEDKTDGRLYTTPYPTASSTEDKTDGRLYTTPYPTASSTEDKTDGRLYTTPYPTASSTEDQTDGRLYTTPYPTASSTEDKTDRRMYTTPYTISSSIWDSNMAPPRALPFPTASCLPGEGVGQLDHRQK